MTSTTLVLSSNLDDQTHLNDARVHRVAKGTAALMYTALLSSTSGKRLIFTSVTVQVTSHLALENLRNEMRSDPVSALATQCTRTATATV